MAQYFVVTDENFERWFFCERNADNPGLDPVKECLAKRGWPQTSATVSWWVQPLPENVYQNYVQSPDSEEAEEAVWDMLDPRSKHEFQGYRAIVSLSNPMADYCLSPIDRGVDSER